MAFPTITLFNMAESECIFDRLLIKCGEIEWYFRPLHCSIWRNRSAFSTVYLLKAAKSNGVSDLCFLQCGELGNEKQRKRRSNHRFRSRETWQCDCYAGFSEGVSAVFVLIRRLISSLCCRLWGCKRLSEGRKGGICKWVRAFSRWYCLISLHWMSHNRTVVCHFMPSMCRKTQVFAGFGYSERAIACAETSFREERTVGWSVIMLSQPSICCKVSL